MIWINLIPILDHSERKLAKLVWPLETPMVQITYARFQKCSLKKFFLWWADLYSSSCRALILTSVYVHAFVHVHWTDAICKAHEECPAWACDHTPNKHSPPVLRFHHISIVHYVQHVHVSPRLNLAFQVRWTEFQILRIIKYQTTGSHPLSVANA